MIWGGKEGQRRGSRSCFYIENETSSGSMSTRKRDRESRENCIWKREANDLNLKWKLLCSLAWNVMYSHLHSSDSRKLFQRFCHRITAIFSGEAYRNEKNFSSNKKIYRLWIFNDSLYHWALFYGLGFYWARSLFRAMSDASPFRDEITFNDRRNLNFPLARFEFRRELSTLDFQTH